jgi:hypothetical protein
MTRQEQRDSGERDERSESGHRRAGEHEQHSEHIAAAAHGDRFFGPMGLPTIDRLVR